jgi:hypothetical protein
MFKSLKQGKDMALRIVLVMKVFWSFGFVSFGIVSNFVLRYSDFSPAKENDYVSPLPGALLKPPVLPVVADYASLARVIYGLYRALSRLTEAG